jgi:hypothetical protein
LPEEAQCAAEPAPVEAALCTLEGEELNFDVGFWLFKNAAHARMTLNKNKSDYIAVFEAKTFGFIGFLARHLSETMQSVMRYDTQSRKFKPAYFEEVLTQGEKTRKRIVSYNYAQNTFTVTQGGTNIKSTSITRKLPHKECDDLLTAFYNFRLGRYGEVARGKSFPITICVKQRPSKIIITVPEVNTPAAKNPCTTETPVTIAMDRDITHIASKRISGCLSMDLVPLSGVVEDAYLFGDLTITLKERKFIK